MIEQTIKDILRENILTKRFYQKLKDIRESRRLKLKTIDDYKSLFDEYETTLPSKESYLREILNYMDKYKRVALTCFEKDVNKCHRTRIKDYIVNNLQSDTNVAEL